MARDWRKISWLSFKAYYRRIFGREYDGVAFNDDDLKIEWFIKIIEGKEQAQKKRWSGQESCDMIYNGYEYEEE